MFEGGCEVSKTRRVVPRVFPVDETRTPTRSGIRIGIIAIKGLDTGGFVQEAKLSRGELREEIGEILRAVSGLVRDRG
jgi:hypothetical protein